jgi:hypothetical protein
VIEEGRNGGLIVCAAYGVGAKGGGSENLSECAVSSSSILLRGSGCSQGGARMLARR